MKMFKYILTLVVAMMSLSSCHYLDKEADTELTMQMVFDDKDRMEGVLAYVYAGLPDPLWGLNFGYGMSSLADDLRPSWRWHQWSWDCNKRATGEWATNTGWNGNVWANMPKRIRQAVMFQQNVHAIPEDNVTQKEVELMKLECRALVAYYYWWFAYWYGPCPFVEGGGFYDPNSSAAELQFGQRPWDEIIDWCDEELATVAEQLPAVYADPTKFGRVDKMFCLATRARMLLFNAGELVNGKGVEWYKNHKNNEGTPLFPQAVDNNKWTRATQACKELIDAAEENGFQLYKEYNDDGSIDPFMSLMGAYSLTSKAGNREVLFAKYSVDYGSYIRYGCVRGDTGANGGMSVSQSLVDAFAMSNGMYPIEGYANGNVGFDPVINELSGYDESGFASEEVWAKTKWTGAEKHNGEKALITGKDIYNMYVNREPRFYITVTFNEKWVDNFQKRKANFYNSKQEGYDSSLVGHSKTDNDDTHDAPNNGYLNNKGNRPEDNPKTGSYAFRQGKFYGLAEAYLNYVECLIETNQLDNTDLLKYWNLVRERAGVPQYSYSNVEGMIQVSKDQATLRDLIRRERRVELCCEDTYIRYTDMRRWMIAEEACQGTDYYHGGMNFKGVERSCDPNNNKAFFKRSSNEAARKWKKEYYWMPIYQTEVDKNPNLVQLPFWETAEEEVEE